MSVGCRGQEMSDGVPIAVVHVGGERRLDAARYSGSLERKSVRSAPVMVGSETRIEGISPAENSGCSAASLPRRADQRRKSCSRFAATSIPRPATTSAPATRFASAKDHFVVSLADGRLDVRRGDVPEPDVAVDTDARTFAAVLTRGQDIKEAMRSGQVRMSGDSDTFDRLLDALLRPKPGATPSP